MKKHVLSSILLFITFCFNGCTAQEKGAVAFLSIMLFLILIVVLIIKTNKKYYKNIAKHKQDYDTLLTNLKDFKLEQSRYGGMREFSIIFDSKNKKIGFIDNKLKPQIYKFNDVIKCEVIMNGQTISTKSAGNALVGAALFGGVGALVAGSGGTTKQTQKIQNILMKINVNDSNNPLYRINFFIEGIERGSQALNQAIKESEKWQGIFAIIIEQNNESKNTQKQNNISITDELIKLKKLFDDGVLTEAEFNQEKQKILTK